MSRTPLAKAGVLRAGGELPDHLKGFFFEPIVIANATKDMDVETDETFGPLAASFDFDTELGLAGYLFSKDIGTILRVARRLKCGMIGVNTGLFSAVEAPFGGIKESSVGRDGIRYILCIL